MQTRLDLPGYFAVTDTLHQDSYALTLRATDRRDGSDVVLKALRPLQWLTAHETAARCARVQTRLALLPALEAPSLVPAREIAVTGGSVVLVRDYISATSLRALLDRGMRLSVEATAGVASQIARALDALAAYGIAHGAVTPENVFLFENGSVRLADPLFHSESRIVPLAGIRCQAVGRQRPGGDVEALAALLFESMTGIPATRSLASSVARAYQLPSQTRYTLMRAMSGGRSRFATATDLASSLLPATGSVLFRSVWRPAAAAGLLGALATLGGYAYSEKTESLAPRVTRTVQVDSSPAIRALRLTEDDQSTLRLAYRRLGPAALANPTMGEILQLSERQQARIAAILAAQRTRVETLVDSTTTGAGSVTASAMRTIRESNGAALMQILEPSQRAAWDAAHATAAAAGEPLL